MAKRVSKAPKTRRRYTAEERAAAVADVPGLGVVKAALKHKVPESCVSHWAKSAGVTRSGDSKPSREEEPTPKASRAEPPRKARVVAGGSDKPSRPATRDQSASAGAAQPAVAVPVGRTLKTRVAKLYTPSKKATVLDDAAKDGVTAAAEKHGVSRFSIYAWQGKVAKAAAGEGASPTSGPAPMEIEAQRDKEILDEWHRHPGLGPSQIKNQLRRKSIKTSVNTVRRVMEDAGYRPPKVERQPHDRFYEATRPNHLWHLDFVQRNIHKANTFTLILIDDFSRYVVGHGVDEGAERADFVIAAFEEAVTRHGRPEMLMHDKGSAFWSWKGVSRFTALITEMGIDQIPAEHKEWNGKVEVFNANLHKELFDAHRFYDLGEMRRRLATHLHWYNHARTHHALGGLLVPADRYYGRVEEVLARIEAGAGRDVNDLLDLRERCLDLFKVVSRGGVAEVWLMGQRLLELPAGARP
jgi:transposase InsO family protein/transposase-like protein